MRVLMLGWEFPPHISGGLGTACLGLARGLAHDGVAVRFVVPRAWGDEDARHAEVIGADTVPLPRATPSDRQAGRSGNPPGQAGGSGFSTAADPADTELAEVLALERLVAEVPLSSRDAELLRRMARRVELLAVDSALRPYLTPQGYAERLAALGSASSPATPLRSGAGTRGGDPEIGAGTASLPSGGSAIGDVLGRSATGESANRPEPDPEPPSPTALRFEGGYGPSLIDEVGRYARVVAELARGQDFDLVHAHDWMTYPAGMLAAAVSGRPLVAHVHATEHDRSGDNPNPQVHEIERLGMLAADRVICVSHFVAATVRERYGVPTDRIRVLHNAVTLAEESEAFHAVKLDDVPIVLFLGRVTYQKGPDYFLEAARRVVAIEPRVNFVVSGTGDLLPGVIERAAAMGLARHVHFTGFLRGRDVERMYALADVYVMPSVSEPFGISPLEAMALDVPVIVSRQSGVSEVIQSALKFDFWDVDDLANKILAVLRRPAMREQLATEGGEEARRMRWDIRGRRLHEIYRELRS